MRLWTHFRIRRLRGALLSQAAIVDRDHSRRLKRVIKDSDIVQELRLTAFLNNEKSEASFYPPARRPPTG